MLCGVIRGCLEQLQLRVECRFEKETGYGLIGFRFNIGVPAEGVYE